MEQGMSEELKAKITEQALEIERLLTRINELEMQNHDLIERFAPEEIQGALKAQQGAAVMPGQWVKSFTDCWPVEEDDLDGDWAVGNVMRDGDEIYYPVITVEAAQYDAPGESEKIARALVSLLNPACEVTRVNASRVPDGWRWVPVEPTLNMLGAALMNQVDCVDTIQVIRADYKAMLSAAPTPAAEPAHSDVSAPNYKGKFERLVDHAKRQDKVIAGMRYDENIRKYYDDGAVWFWAGDETDNLETLACPVVINAGDLRALLAGGEV
jgi:hypothetical protein